MGYASRMAEDTDHDKEKDREDESLLSSLRKLVGQVGGSTLGLARNTAAMTAMFGESRLV